MDSKTKIEFHLGENTWWSCGFELAPVILAALKQFYFSKRNGYPVSGDTAKKLFFEGDHRPVDELDAECAAAWERSLQKMILAFSLLSNDDISSFLSEEQQADVDDGLLEFAAHFQDLWD